MSDIKALLKFAGVVSGAGVSYLADEGLGGDGTSTETAPNYPLPAETKLENLAVNVRDFTVPDGGAIIVELLKDGVAVPSFTVTYNAGEGGIKVAKTHDKEYDKGHTFDVQVTTTGLGSTVGISATVGIS